MRRLLGAARHERHGLQPFSACWPGGLSRRCNFLNDTDNTSPVGWCCLFRGPNPGIIRTICDLIKGYESVIPKTIVRVFQQVGSFGAHLLW